MKRLLPLIVYYLCPITLNSQRYFNIGAFPDTSIRAKRDIGCISADLCGRIRILVHDSTDNIKDSNNITCLSKTIFIANLAVILTLFPPINPITVHGNADTLFNSGHGLTSCKEGNIHDFYFEALDKFNYETGQALHKTIPATILVENVTNQWI